MKLPQIRISTTDIKMDWQIQKPVQKIQQPRASQKIEQPAATLEINTTRGKLNIDSTQARKDLGLIGPLESVANYAKEGKKANLEGIARRVREGNQMMGSAGKGQEGAVFKNIAKQNHGPKRTPFNIKFVPSVGSVKVNYTPGSTNVNITQQKPKIDVQVNKPIHDYTPGDVTGTMLQRPNVEIDVMK